MPLQMPYQVAPANLCTYLARKHKVVLNSPYLAFMLSLKHIQRYAIKRKSVWLIILCLSYKDRFTEQVYTN